MSEFLLNSDSLNKLIEISIDAGKAIMDIYKTDFDFEKKNDESPITAADLCSHEIISDSLSKLTPKIPILSEESSYIPFTERSCWDEYWLIDPLDGTKEFINRNGEFTTNIALMKNNKPAFGIIHAPCLNQTYWGGESLGSYYLEGDLDSDIKKINVSSSFDQEIKMVSSRSHPSNDLKCILKMIGDHKILSIGSSLKFCLIAKGEADCYLRLGPTSEWDTAAGDAIVKSAGGSVKVINGSELEYNKLDSILNPSFIAAANEELVFKILDIINSNYKKINHDK